jgi:hypothetical protein
MFCWRRFDSQHHCTVLDKTTQCLKTRYNAQSEPFLALNHQNLPATPEIFGCGFFTKFKGECNAKTKFVQLTRR